MKGTVKSILVNLRRPLTRTPPLRLPGTSYGHDQCAEGSTANLCPHHFFHLRIVTHTGTLQFIDPVTRRDTGLRFSLSHVLRSPTSPASSPRWALIGIY